MPVNIANPFGVMIGSPKMTAEESVAVAKELGAAYFRPADIQVDTDKIACPACDYAKEAGLKLVLTVRNGGGKGKSSSPPVDILAYRQRIQTVLQKYQPSLLVVENEENSRSLFYSGTPAQYHQELQAACEVAHSLGYKCANGGLVSNLVALLVADDFQELGQTGAADDFRKLAMNPDQYRRYTRNPTAPLIVEQIQRGKALLNGYKTSGADYVNFHWYIADAAALKPAVDYLHRATGLPVLSNEMGQQNNEDPAQVTNIMQAAVDLNLPIAVWFSFDSSGLNGARSLINPDGSLRLNGIAFQTFIPQHF